MHDRNRPLAGHHLVEGQLLQLVVLVNLDDLLPAGQGLDDTHVDLLSLGPQYTPIGASTARRRTCGSI